MEEHGARLMEFEKFLKAKRLVPFEKVDFYLFDWGQIPKTIVVIK